jgi:hypothetical protein
MDYRRPAGMTFGLSRANLALWQASLQRLLRPQR